MRYFLLRHEYSDSGYVDGDVAFIPPLTGYYQAGTPLEVGDRAVSVTMDKAVRKLKADFFLTTSGAFFAAEKLATLLKRYQNDLRIIPAHTSYSSGRATEKRYMLVHANRRLPCFDYRRSEYAGKALALQRLERGESADAFLVKGVQALAIDEKFAVGANFFFIKNVVLIDPVVSESLEKEIREQKFNVRLEAVPV
ncbi:hypothetical protein C9I57_09965 [Trinickia symbiotica]|uniref:Uncharacterized protein n=2 Tax=Trinickia symbiotica TaxID=863227 RepID=A0A2T3XWZ8_9BURK|nr:hypothetical protein C9I57_09965 [Trinickia symbiotica]